jgi:transposase
MGPYSNDCRRKAVRASERGEGSQRKLVRVFGVSVSFVQDLLQRYRQTGSVFVFINRRGTLIKTICGDRTGFCLPSA